MTIAGNTAPRPGRSFLSRPAHSDILRDDFFLHSSPFPSVGKRREFNFAIRAGGSTVVLASDARQPLRPPLIVSGREQGGGSVFFCWLSTTAIS